MEKKSLYPKTKRMGDSVSQLTEKLDGSNLGIFKINGDLLIAQRNYVYSYSEAKEYCTYKGLLGWLDTHYGELIDNLHEGSGVFGEWIGMGQIGYGNTDIDKRFYIFAKANVSEELDIRNIVYKRDTFIYPFIDQIIPEFIGIVPLVDEDVQTDITTLDSIYETYCNKVNRRVEGFIVIEKGNITKYVRFKGGKESEHKK